MSAHKKAPKRANEWRPISEATGQETSAMNMPKERNVVNALASAIGVAPISPDQLVGLYERLAQVHGNLDAVAKVFRLVADQSSEFDVVQPLAEAGVLLTGNVSEAVNGVLVRLGTLVGQLVLEGVA
jgi:hypothetical protein